jgi:hypothetical protein
MKYSISKPIKVFLDNTSCMKYTICPPLSLSLFMYYIYYYYYYAKKTEAVTLPATNLPPAPRWL